MKKKSTAPDGVSIIEKEVPTTKIERTIKLTIKGQEFELTFAEASAIAAAIDRATGKAKLDLAERLNKSLNDSISRIPRDPYLPRPYSGPYPTTPPSFLPGTIFCQQR